MTSTTLSKEHENERVLEADLHNRRSAIRSSDSTTTGSACIFLTSGMLNDRIPEAEPS